MVGEKRQNMPSMHVKAPFKSSMLYIPESLEVHGPFLFLLLLDQLEPLLLLLLAGTVTVELPPTASPEKVAQTVHGAHVGKSTVKKIKTRPMHERDRAGCMGLGSFKGRVVSSTTSHRERQF